MMLPLLTNRRLVKLRPPYPAWRWFLISMIPDSVNSRI